MPLSHIFNASPVSLSLDFSPLGQELRDGYQDRFPSCFPHKMEDS